MAISEESLEKFLDRLLDDKFDDKSLHLLLFSLNRIIHIEGLQKGTVEYEFSEMLTDLLLQNKKTGKKTILEALNLAINIGEAK